MQAFGEGTPAIGWDEEAAYTRQRVRLFYCSFCGTVLREDQIAETLQERFPSGYVETGCQVCPSGHTPPPVCVSPTSAHLGLAFPSDVLCDECGCRRGCRPHAAVALLA